MNKLINTKCLLKIGILCIFVTAALQAATRTVTRYDDFSGTILPAFWTLDDSPASYSGGGFAMPGDGIARFNNVGNYSYAHIQSVDTLDTTYGIRVDAIMRQDHWPTSTFGMGVGIYYDPSNWVSIKQGAAGGQEGWMKQALVGGTMDYEMGTVAAALRSYWLISGVELTATQIKFYGSSISPMWDYYGETDIDNNVEEITEFAMARPAGFTGEALVIVGKGVTWGLYNWLNPDFDNSTTSDNWAFAGIDYVRIQRTVIDPNYCGDTGTVYLEMDFNQDCIVDFKDLDVFVSQWLQCTDPQDPYCDQFLP